MCAAYVAWALFAIIAFPLGLVTWWIFWALLLPSALFYSDPRIRMSKKASAFLQVGVPLLGVCIVIWVVFSIAEPPRPGKLPHPVQGEARQRPRRPTTEKGQVFDPARHGALRSE